MLTKDLIANVRLFLPIIVFWLILFSLGYPPPHMDDLFFVGAPINLAQSGDFVNDWIYPWSDRVIDRFYVQPPFHQYLLAAWILLFGVNTKSFLLFQCFWYIIFSIFLALCLEKYKFSSLITWCSIPLYAIAMSQVGLRTEAVGMAFFAIGIWLLTEDSLIRYFWGFFCVGIALLSYLITVVYAIPFAGVIVITNFAIARHIKNRGQLQQYITTRILCWLGAVFFVFLLFLICINFELFHFLSDLAWHSQMRRGSLTENITIFCQQLTQGYGELVYGCLYSLYTTILVFTVLKYKQVRYQTLVFASILTLSLLANAFFYIISIYRGIFHFFMCLEILILLFEIKPGKLVKTIFVFLTVATFLIHNSLTLIASINCFNCQFNAYSNIRQYVQQHPELTYVVDNYAARYVFDYKLPLKTISWSFVNKAPDFWPVSIEQIPKNAVAITSVYQASSLESLKEVPNLPDWPKVELFGYQFNSIPRYPQDVVIIPSIQE
jgi:hypothetical protein